MACLDDVLLEQLLRGGLAGEALGEVADFITLGDLGEATERFPHFAAIDGVVD